MKKLLLFVCLCLFGVGCAAQTDAPSSDKPASIAPTTTVAPKPTVDTYVLTMRDIYPTASRADLIDLGKTACDVIRSQGSVRRALIAVASNPAFAGMEEDAAYTFGAAIPVFCPEYLDEALNIARS